MSGKGLALMLVVLGAVLYQAEPHDRGRLLDQASIITIHIRDILYT